MFDILDIENIRDDNYLEGTYYIRKPKTTEDYGVPFSYYCVDPQSKEYGKIIGDLRSDPNRTTIRTNEDCKWKIGGFISTQDGLFWTIELVGKEVQNDRNKEALRVVTQPSDTDYTLRLLIQGNPWGLE